MYKLIQKQYLKNLPKMLGKSDRKKSVKSDVMILKTVRHYLDDYCFFPELKNQSFTATVTTNNFMFKVPATSQIIQNPKPTSVLFLYENPLQAIQQLIIVKKHVNRPLT